MSVLFSFVGPIVKIDLYPKGDEMVANKVSNIIAKTIFPFEDFESLMRTNRNETISFLPNEGSESKSSMRKVV